MFASSSFDIFGNYTLFCSYGLIMAFWAVQWICMKKANQIEHNAPAPKSVADVKPDPDLKRFSLANIDMDEYGSGIKKKPELILGPKPEAAPLGMNKSEYMPEKESKRKWFFPFGKKNKDPTSEYMDTQASLQATPFFSSEPNSATSSPALGFAKAATSLTPQYFNLERYAKKMSIFVSCSYVIVNMVVLVICILFMFGFVIFGFGTFDSSVYKIIRLLWILIMAFVLIFGMSLFGLLLFSEQRKKMKKNGLGGKTWAVAKVSIVSMLMFTILMAGNIITTLFELIFYDIYIENFFGIKWLLHIILSSLEMFAAFYLMFTLRPVQLSCKCCTLSFIFKCYCSLCCCCLIPIFALIKSSRRHTHTEKELAYGGLALDNLVEKLDKNQKENYIPYNTADVLGTKEEDEERERAAGLSAVVSGDSSIMLGIVDDDSDNEGGMSARSPQNLLDFNLASEYM